MTSANPLDPAPERANRGRATLRALALAIGWYLITRAVVLIAALTAPQDRSPTRPYNWWPQNPLIRWDAGHYLVILRAGYPPLIVEGPDRLRSDTIAFFPLYPLIARPVAWFMARVAPPLRPTDDPDWYDQLALVLVSHAFGLAAVTLFIRWGQALTRAADGAALRGSLMLCAFPTAIYFSVGYSESVFLTLIAAALLLQCTGRPWGAALCCGLATATRPTGVVLALVLALMNLRPLLTRLAGKTRTPDATPAVEARPRHGAVRVLIRSGVCGVLSISGLLAYQAFLWRHTGRPDALAVVQSNWERHDAERHTLRNLLALQPVLEPAIKPFKYAIRGQLAKLAEPESWNSLVNIAMLGLAVYGLVRPGPIPRETFLFPIVQFLMGYLADPYSGDRLIGIARYQLAALPCFLLLGSFAWTRRPGPYAGLLLAALVLQVFYIRGYVNWVLVS